MQAMRGKLTESRSAQSVRAAFQRAMTDPEATATTKSYGKMILDALALN